jgi:single-stranded-DNA-specific exonuclease
MERQGWPPEKQKRLTQSFLKLAAIATVADVVPLRGENRAIVALGLDGMRDVRNPGLRQLMQVAGLPEGKPLSPWQVGFQIGPRINAAGRMESARRVIELFRTTDEAEAGRIAKELDELNQERRESEKRILEEILARIEEPRPGIVMAAEGWHRGVVGIVASRIVERFHRPTFVLEIDRESGTATGSGRSIEPYHLLNGLESMRELFLKFGGHSHAAGVTLPVERLEEFSERFSGHVRESLTDEDLVPERRIDAEVSAAEMTEEALRDLARLAPFGNGNPAPVLMLRGASVEARWPMGDSGRHFKIRAVHLGSRIMLKVFDFAERAEEIMPGRRLDVAFTAEEDEKWGWSNRVRDVRPA